MALRSLKKFSSKFLRAKSVPEQNVSQIAQLSRKGERVSFVSSYPRSGNTWVRHLLSDCFIQNSGQPTSTELPIHPDKIIPDRYVNRIVDRDLSVTTSGVFVKTHDTFDDALTLLNQKAYASMRHLYIYRRPEDSLVSYYHFHLRYEHLQQHADKGVDAFVLEHINKWVDHVGSYVKGSEKYPGSVFFLSYERLLADPNACLVPALKFLDVQVQGNTLENAISHMAFENLRANEEKKPLNNDEFFFRKGTSGSGSEELQPKTVEAIASQASQLLEKADEQSLKQCGLSGT